MHNAHFNIKRTCALTYWQIAIHVSTAFILLCLPLAIFIKLCFLMLVVLSFAYYCYQEKRKTCVIMTLAHISKDVWHVYTDRGDKWVVQLLKQNYLSDFLLILRFKFHNEKNKLPALLLLHPQFSEQDWRHVQMIVRGNPRD